MTLSELPMPSTAFRIRVLCNQVRPEHFNLAISRDSNRSRPSDPVNPVAVVNVPTTYAAPVLGQFCPFSGGNKELPHTPK